MAQEKNYIGTRRRYQRRRLGSLEERKLANDLSYTKKAFRNATTHKDLTFIRNKSEIRSIEDQVYGNHPNRALFRESTQKLGKFFKKESKNSRSIPHNLTLRELFGGLSESKQLGEKKTQIRKEILDLPHIENIQYKIGSMIGSKLSPSMSDEELENLLQLHMYE